jgi:hypothetical protein
VANRRDELTEGLEDGLYLLVGMAVLGVQRGRAAARQLVDAPLPERAAKIACAVAEPVLEPVRAVIARAQGRPGA